MKQFLERGRASNQGMMRTFETHAAMMAELCGVSESDESSLPLLLGEDGKAARCTRERCQQFDCYWVGSLDLKLVG